jgi:high-affinity nickel-transport protein
MRHALDPDHVAAVGTIVSRERSIFRAARAGAFWGLGHCVTIVVAGGTILTFRIAVPESASVVLELIVAAMLVGLGALNLKKENGLPSNRSRGVRPVVVGIVHGLAGSAAVALLVVPAIRGPLLALLYLAVFGAGTMLGMMLVTSAMATPLGYARTRFGLSERRLAVSCGIASICTGVFLGIQTLA